MTDQQWLDGRRVMTTHPARPLIVVELKTYGELSSRSCLAIVTDAGERTIVRSQTSTATTSWTCGRCGVSEQPECPHMMAVHAALAALAGGVGIADPTTTDLAATT